VVEGKNPSAATLRMRCRARIAADALAGALEDCNRALELDDENAEVHLLRGEVQFRLDDDAGALADFDTAIRLDRSSAVGYRGRAWALFALGRSSEAMLSFDRSVTLDPDDAETRAGRLILSTILRDWISSAFDASRLIALSVRPS
jgi:tetratricopeptide (TPR) repeat protein